MVCMSGIRDELLTRWGHIQGTLFGWFSEELGPLTDKHEQLVCVLDLIGKLAPGQARYALGTKSGEGRTAKGWNVILPVDVVERRFEGP
jgi:hypothetical protein